MIWAEPVNTLLLCHSDGDRIGMQPGIGKSEPLPQNLHSINHEHPEKWLVNHELSKWHVLAVEELMW